MREKRRHPLVKVLVSDNLAAEGLEVLRSARGIEVIEQAGMSPEALLKIVGDIDGLAIRSGTKVTAEVIAAAEKLRVIGRAGIGVDNVDVAAATQRGIAVLNTPEGNNITTAEHAIALLVSLARHIPQATASMKAGKWEKKKFQGIELYNRTLAVVGLGNIGRIVALRGKALGMKVIAYDPFTTPERARQLDIELVADFDEVMSRADAITVHVPKTKDTIGLLNKATFEKARPGLLVINAARGGIVDEDDLFEALESGQVGGAGLDVFVEEPPPADHRLLSHARVICTPHLGASTEQAQINVSVAVAEQICDFLLNDVVRNAVNVPSISPELMEEVGPFLRLGEKIGRFQGQLCPASIDQVEVEYSGEVGNLNVAPITIAVLKGILESVRDGVNMVNAPSIAQELGLKVIESKVSLPSDFSSLVTVRVRGCEDRMIAGTIFHGRQPRIVRIDDFMLEAIPEGPTIFIQNHDQAGVVGNVGTILGEGGLNISRMQLALIPEKSQAAMLVNVDGCPTEEIMERLRGSAHMITAQLVEL